MLVVLASLGCVASRQLYQVQTEPVGGARVVVDGPGIEGVPLGGCLLCVFAALATFL